MKFSTAWGNLKPAKVIDDCSQRSGTDSAKIIILDSLYKVWYIKIIAVFEKNDYILYENFIQYTIERGMEVFSTAEVELNTYPSIAPLLTSLLPNAVYIFR